MKSIIINGVIRYVESSGTIETLDRRNKVIRISKPACRLFSLLIINNNELILREKLLYEVWEKHGLTASNNNLNNYISTLRKALTSLGEDKVLLTIPKQGFVLHADSIQYQEGDAVRSELISQSVDDTLLEKVKPATYLLSNENKVKKNEAKFIKIHSWSILCGTICLFLLLSLLLTFKQQQQLLPFIKRIEIGKIIQCKVYFITTNYKNNYNGSLSEIKSKIIHLGYNCNLPADIYYYMLQFEASSDNKSKRYYYITYCPGQNFNGAVSQCENNYLHE